VEPPRDWSPSGGPHEIREQPMPYTRDILDGTQCPGSFLDIIGNILVFPSPTAYMLQSSIFSLLILIQYILDSFNVIDNFHAVSNFNRLFHKLNRFICNYCSGRFSPFIVGTLINWWCYTIHVAHDIHHQPTLRVFNWRVTTRCLIARHKLDSSTWHINLSIALWKPYHPFKT